MQCIFAFPSPFLLNNFSESRFIFLSIKIGSRQISNPLQEIGFFFFLQQQQQQGAYSLYYVDIYVYKTSSIVLIGGILAVLRVILSDESGYKKFGILGLTFLPFSKFCNLFHFEKSSKLGKTKCNEENSSSNKSLLQVSYTQIHHYSSSTFPISIN